MKWDQVQLWRSIFTLLYLIFPGGSETFSFTYQTENVKNEHCELDVELVGEAAAPPPLPSRLCGRGRKEAVGGASPWAADPQHCYQTTAAVEQDEGAGEGEG